VKALARLCLACASMAWALSASGEGTEAPSPAPKPWRIVLIRSWDATYPFNVARESALQAALLADAPRVVEIYSEDLDPLRFQEGFEAELAALLRRKYRHNGIDLVIASGIEPLQFAEKHRDELWPGVPILFYGVFDGALDGWARPAGITGVTLPLDVAGTLEAGAALDPGARTVYVVSGTSAFDRLYYDLAMKQAARLPQFEMRPIVGQSMHETLNRLPKAGSGALVLYLSMLRDGSGQIAGPGTTTMGQVSKASGVPVLSASYTQFGRGPLGGSAARLDEHGRIAGGIARRILAGENPDSIPIVAAPAPVCELDWNALRRWNVPDRNVPASCTVTHRPVPVLQAYFWQLLVVAAVILAQAILIALLVAQRRRRVDAEVRARERGEELSRVARLSTVGALTASIAHEINQPIGAILSNAEAATMLLDQGALDPATLREILSDIRSADLRASEVIQRLRKLLSQAERKFEALAVNVEVAEALRHVAVDAARRNVTLTPAFGSAVPVIMGDPIQLQQVVINFVVNALDALGDLPENEREVRIETRAVAGGAEIAVIDRGPGVAPEDRDNLFHSTFTRKKGGMGFGLSIVKTIVEMHGGEVSYEPNVPRGAIFRVRFPAIGT